MTAKEIQAAFIKSYLKPTLKAHGYSTNAQTWWKNKGDFFIVINLQNSQWNSKEDLSFCFNIGVALTALLRDKEKKKAGYFDIITPVRENAYLPEERRRHGYRSGLGYTITNNTRLAAFIDECRTDFEVHILPILGQLQTLKDCVRFYDKYDFVGPALRRRIEAQGIQLDE
ncbi:DUF4304 domain-containing protein [Chitinophaga agrisoli]|uniref:DUF4304 domain-containing protein n=1 Tax=Chitinophaga agrisoli TaxID=2607653 RepID=A0A5B2VKS9_9BACT|nr:DUF4304 domain-containing protein [Chitinophaga agrisoli]KAA2238857.1 DUF4304 domain-containing protein [Chitinophaga agrisoli]